METRAIVHNAGGAHAVTLVTDGRIASLDVPPKGEGRGSSANGGELLCLALATCFCNDLYREAALRGLSLTRVEVEVVAEFGGRGEGARAIRYAARVEGDASDAELAALVEHTDRVAEVHETLRAGIAVELQRPAVEARA